MDKENFYGGPVYTGELSEGEICSLANIAEPHYAMQNAINTPVQYKSFVPMQQIDVYYGNNNEKPAFCYENNHTEKKQEVYVTPGCFYNGGNEMDLGKNMRFPGYNFEKRVFGGIIADYNDPDNYKDLSRMRNNSSNNKNNNQQQNNTYMNQPTTVQTGNNYGLGGTANVNNYNIGATNNGTLVYTNNPNISIDQNGNICEIGNPAAGLVGGHFPTVNINNGNMTVEGEEKKPEEITRIYIPPYNPLGINALPPSDLNNTLSNLAITYIGEKAEAEAKAVAEYSRAMRSGKFNTLSANYYGQLQITPRNFLRFDGGSVAKTVDQINHDAKINGLNLSMNLSKLAHNYLKDGVTEEKIRDIYCGKYENIENTPYYLSDFDKLELRAKDWVLLDGVNNISWQTKRYRSEYNQQRANIEKVLPPNTRAEDFGMFASELYAKWEDEEIKTKNRSLNDQFDHNDYLTLLRNRILEEHIEGKDEVHISPIKVNRVIAQHDLDMQTEELFNGLCNAFNNAENRYPGAVVPFKMTSRKFERRVEEFSNYIKNIVVNCLDPAFANYSYLLYSFSIDNNGDIVYPNKDYIRNILLKEALKIQEQSQSQAVNVNEIEYIKKKNNFNTSIGEIKAFDEFVESVANLDDPKNRAAADEAKTRYAKEIVLNGIGATDPLADLILKSGHGVTHYSLSDNNTKKEDDNKKDKHNDEEEDKNSPPNNERGDN